MTEATRPEGRRFWVAEDVANWITANVPTDQISSSTPVEAAVWWRC